METCKLEGVLFYSMDECWGREGGEGREEGRIGEGMRREGRGGERRGGGGFYHLHVWE